jgi:hypothetical protein
MMSDQQVIDLKTLGHCSKCGWSPKFVFGIYPHGYHRCLVTQKYNLLIEILKEIKEQKQEELEDGE